MSLLLWAKLKMKIQKSDVWRLFPDTFAQKVSSNRWKNFEFTKFLAENVTHQIINGGGRICISAPPRHGKSEFLSTWLPIWFLEMFPDKKIILSSYSAELASTFGRKIRDEMATNPLITTRLSENSQASNRFDTESGGGMITAGVNGPITGKGAHLFLIDDPYKNMQDALSETYDRNLKSWYESVARTRLEPNGTMIIIMTRWKEDDLVGWLVKNHSFQEINLPAIAEENDIMGRPHGQPLCSERYPLSELQKIKADVGSYVWNALYQQNPIPIKGGLFKRVWWNRYRELPVCHRVVQFWDCAQKVGITNDYSVCATWGEFTSGYYLIDLWREKVEAPQLEQAVKTLYTKHKPSAVVIEDKSSGSSIIQHLRQKTTIPVIAYDPKSRDKEVRASAATPTVEAGKCFLPENAPWVEDFIIEHERFPNASHDDIVDTTSMAIEYFRVPRPMPRIREL